jgi:hypothetical protein
MPLIVTGKAQLPLTANLTLALVTLFADIPDPVKPPVSTTLVTEVGSNKAQMLLPTVRVQAARLGAADKKIGAASKTQKALARKREDMGDFGDLRFSQTRGSEFSKYAQSYPSRAFKSWQLRVKGSLAVVNPKPERAFLLSRRREKPQRKPTDACQTNASSKKKSGMMGRMSTSGPNAW